MQKSKVTRKNLNQQIQVATKMLLEMAKEHAWNKISDNVKYVVNKFKTDQIKEENFFSQNRIRKRHLLSKEQFDLETVVQQLKAEFENIYLIDLYVFKANKKETIVEIGILEKSELGKDQKEIMKEVSPMLHAKVAIPPYIESKSKTKFDINWQLETAEYKWKMFWLQKNKR
ncbi:MAG: hypothetical protein AAF847_00410 [Bacteroidota bacterium]